MVARIPVYVEAVKQPSDHRTVYRCRPLFFDAPATRSEHLARAVARLARSLGEKLYRIGREARHDELAEMVWSPPVETRQCKFSVDLRKHIAKCRFLFVSFPAFGRVVAFTPSVPDLWFEVAPGEELASTAERFVAAHFKRLVDRDGWSYAQLDELSLTGRAWVTALDVGVHASRPVHKESKDLWAALAGGREMDGNVELGRCGRCLDWLYPYELDLPLLRDEEVGRLDGALAASDRRPVALVGPRMAGKTAVVHGAVRKRVRRRKPREDGKRMWLLSPQRLIAGMMAVGQWERRLLAILEEAGRLDHVLYFDDVLGLYRAGAHADSDLTLGDVLRTHVQRGDVRVLAEMTPEAFRALAERDRGLADQFQVLRVEPLGAPETLRVLLSIRRRLEIRYRCLFDVDVLPTVLDLQRRYVRDAVFPGKGAAFLQQLAVAHPRAELGRDAVYAQFHEQTGLALALLDGRRRLRRADVLDALRRRLVGQEPALEALADVVSIAKARLNATDRPLATLLLMGPTGVGKTECAKALAAYLFGRDERLVRLDMNEFDSPAAAARLVGTFLEPEGRLTASVRRQPFCVVLLDEIEKAHPAVFDMLLQVMGEGRLTDAVGRTTDFSSAIVIMTSNLGTREVAKRIGFGGGEEQRERAFVAAAESFFRPEFVNRIDRIIPFRPLNRRQMRGIAERLLAEVIGREGLVRRRCALSVDPRAMELVVDEGYRPELGARALKRMLERRLIQPVSARLSALKPELPVAVEVHAGRGGIVVRVSALTEVEPPVLPKLPAEAADALRRIEAALAGMEDEIGEDRPRGPIDPETLTPAQEHYLEMSDRIASLREEAEDIAVRGGAGREDGGLSNAVADYVVRRPGRLGSRAVRKLRADYLYSPAGDIWTELIAASDLHAWLRDVHAAGSPFGGSGLAGRLASLRNETALLVARHAARGGPEREVLFVRGPGRAAAPWVRRLTDLYREAFFSGSMHEAPENARAAWDPVTFLVVEGVLDKPMTSNEVGTHLVVDRQGGLVPLQVGRLPAGESCDGFDGLLGCFEETRRAWLERVDRGKATLDDDPFPIRPVVRIYDERAATLDLRTRLSAPRWPEAADLQTFLGAGLALGGETD